MWGNKKNSDEPVTNGERSRSSHEEEPSERTRLLQDRPPPVRNDGYLDVMSFANRGVQHFSTLRQMGCGMSEKRDSGLRFLVQYLLNRDAGEKSNVFNGHPASCRS